MEDVTRWAGMSTQELLQEAKCSESWAENMFILAALHLNFEMTPDDTELRDAVDMQALRCADLAQRDAGDWQKLREIELQLDIDQ